MKGREEERVGTNSAQKIKADFRPFTFHHLRHLFAVEWLKSGCGIYESSQHLGHRSVKTTKIGLAFPTAAIMKGAAQKPNMSDGSPQADQI